MGYFVRGQHKENSEKHYRDEHIQAEWMDVRTDFSIVEFPCEKAWPTEQYPDSTPYFTVVLINIFEVLFYVFLERLPRV